MSLFQSLIKKGKEVIPLPVESSHIAANLPASEMVPHILRNVINIVHTVISNLMSVKIQRIR